MKFCTACTLALLISAASVGATKEHPIVRVIGLVEGLIEKAEEEGKTEGLAYETYVYQCGVNKDTLTKAISEENAKIDEPSDTIDAKTKTIASLDKEIGALDEEAIQNEKTQTKQSGERNSTNELYTTTKGELTLTIGALKDALALMTGAENSTESNLLSSKAKVQRAHKALALLQKLKALPQAMGDLEKHVDKYDFKSESVIELLKQLLSKFEAELVATEEAETNSLNAYSLSKLSLENMMAAVAKSKKTKSDARTEADKDLTAAKGDKLATEGDLEADTATLKSSTEACLTKKQEWERRSATRADEITAMKSAVTIMSKVTGVRTEAPANPVPPPSPVAFLQLVAAPKNGDSRSKVVSRVMNLLLTTAEAQHSKMLKQFAEEVSVKLRAPYDDYTFQPVINQIEKMIFFLQEEQKAEDDHKNWCDKDLEKTTAMKENHEDKEQMLQAKLMEEKSKVQQLAENIKTQEAMLAKIVAFQAEATEIRKVGKKENKLALKDSQDAQAALADAIAVLTEFYKSSGEVAKKEWEFLQEPVSLPEDPATWVGEYTATSDPKNQPTGILAVLSGVAKEFAAMEADTVEQEAQDQKAYDDEISNMDIEKARRTQDVEEKTLEKSHRSSLVKELTSNLKHTQAELGKTNEYLADLQKACVTADSTYDARKAARDQEITALREAETILNTAFEVPVLPGKPKKIPKKTKFLRIQRHM